MATRRYRDEAVGGQKCSLPLRSDGLDRLDVHALGGERDRRLSDEDLAEGRRLLQAGRGVHGISGDESLSCGRVAGHDFTGVHA